MLPAYRLIVAGLNLLVQNGAFDSGPKFEAVAEMVGDDSQVLSQRIVLVQEPGDWARLWNEHKAVMANAPSNVNVTNKDMAVPNVDFRKTVIVGVFGGQTRDIANYRVVLAGESQKAAILRIQPTVLPRGGGGLLTQPFLMAVVSRSKKPLEIQMPFEQGGKVVWRTVATFKPTLKRGS